MAKYQIGVLAVTDRGKQRIVLVTTRSGSDWIFPKGRKEKGRSDWRVALEEAYEEAGVVGKITSQYREYKVRSGDASILRLYRMRVRKVLKSWPENHERDRRLVSKSKAEKLLPKRLRTCLSGL